MKKITKNLLLLLGVSFLFLNVNHVRAAELDDDNYGTSLVSGTPFEVTDDNQVIYNVNIPHIIINQVYGGGKKTAYASNNFIELYNTTDKDVDLIGWSVQYRSSADGANSTGWEKLDLTEIIPAKSSYLIRCGSISSPASSLVIDQYDQEWKQNIHNKGYAVALVSNTNLIGADAVVFDNDTHQPMINGYVDLFAVAGNDKLDTQIPAVYESEVSSVQSKKISIRRIGFADTDNNGVGKDMETVDYSFSKQEYIDYIAPRCAADGSWEASDAPAYTVTFVTNGADEIPSQSIPYTKKIVEPKVPVKGTEMFTGWYSDEQLAVLFDFSVVPTEDVVLYAGWAKDEKASAIADINELITQIPKYYKEYYSEQSVNAISEVMALYQQKDLNDCSIEECNDLKNKLSETLSSLSYKVGTVPQVYITTDNGDGNSLSKPIGYVPTSIAVVDTNGKYVGTSAGSIKVRGNSTAYAAKKPYNIKFDSKTNVLGMGKAKKWCMLANCFDPTMMRNYLAIDTARELGINYTSEQQYVELWIDGKYKGCYVLMEAVEAGSTRVDIDLNKGDFLVEGDNRNESDVTYVTVGYKYALKEPEEPTAEQTTYIYNTLTDINNVIKSGDWDLICQRVDMDSFVKYYILNEYFKTVDFGFSSAYFYYKDGVLYAGPAWDYDLSSGNANNHNYLDYFDSNGDSHTGSWGQKYWYKTLCKYPEFNALVNSTYLEYHDLLANIYIDGGKIDELLSTYGEVFRNNEVLAGWDPGIIYNELPAVPQKTYAENIDFLRNWLIKRDAWLMGYWGLDKIDNENVIISGPCGQSIQYILYKDGTLSVEGLGVMSDYTSGKAPWYPYKDQITSIVISEGITYLGNYAFANCVNVTEVSLPETLTSIGARTFSKLTYLRDIQLPESLNRINASAFSECKNLEKIVFPSQLKVIAGYAFSNCTSLREIVFLGGPCSINSASFTSVKATCKYPSGDTRWKEEHFQMYGGSLVWIEGGDHEHDFDVVVINGTCTTEGYSLYKCKACDYEEIKDYTPEVHDWKIIGIIENPTESTTGSSIYKCNLCEKETEFEVPAFKDMSIRKSGVFEGTTSWTLYDNGILRISGVGNTPSFASEEEIPWRKYSKVITNVVIDDGIESIGVNLFYNLTKLVAVSMPDSVTSIGKSAFNYCTSLKYISLSNSLEVIGVGAFRDCKSLEEITIPKSVITVSGNAFSDDFMLKSVTFMGSAPRFSTNVFRNVKATIYYPAIDKSWANSIMLNYGGSLVWTPFSAGEHEHEYEQEIVESGCMTEGYTLYTCSICGDSYKGDEKEALGHDWDNGAITKEPGEFITGIKKYSCLRCEETKEEEIPATGDEPTGKEIATGTCGKKVVWTLNDYGVLTISGTGEMAVTTTTNIPWIEYNEIIKKVVVNSGVSNLGNYLFRNCVNLEEIVIENGLKTIGCSTFIGCTQLKSITFPESIVAINSKAFSGSGLKSITFEGTAPKINAYAFDKVNATVHYYEDSAWATVANQNYSGKLTWESLEKPEHIHEYTSTVVEVGCMTEGYTLFTCLGCGDSYKENELVALGHDWDEGVVTKESSDYFTGIKTYTCSRCEETKEEEIPATAGEPSGKEVVSGTCGRKVSWSLNDFGVFTISGTGEMSVTTTTSIPWIEYNDLIKKVIVESGVSSISNYAFRNCKNLEEVEIGNGVKIIGCSSFIGCTKLRTITIPASVVGVSSKAFSGTGLETIIFEGTAPKINGYGFDKVTATVYYNEDSSWETVIDQNYGGKLTWVALENEPENSEEEISTEENEPENSEEEISTEENESENSEEETSTEENESDNIEEVSLDVTEDIETIEEPATTE